MSRKGINSSSSSSSKHWLNANDLAGFVNYTPQQHQQQRGHTYYNSGSGYYYYQQQQEEEHHHHQQAYHYYYQESSEGRYYRHRMVGKFSHTYRLLVKYNNNNNKNDYDYDGGGGGLITTIQDDNNNIKNKLIVTVVDTDYLIPWKYVVGVDITVWYDDTTPSSTTSSSSLPICPICLCIAEVPRIPECGHVMCLSCALRYLQQYSQCCVCNVGITLKELKPVRIEILNNTTKPKNGDIITLNLCEVVDGICRPFDANTLQQVFNHKCGYPPNNKIHIPPRMGKDFGWRYSRVVCVDDDNEVNVLLRRDLKRLNKKINNEEWVDDLEAMGIYMARDYVLKEIHDYNNNNNNNLSTTTTTNGEEDEDDDDTTTNDEAEQKLQEKKGKDDVQNVNDHHDEDPLLLSSSSNNTYFYQYGISHVYLDSLWFKCLMMEYCGKTDAFDKMYLMPRQIKCRIVGIRDIPIDNTSRRNYRSLAHLVHGSTASIVDVDFIKPRKLSHTTLEALKSQIDRKYKYRKEQRRKAYKEDRLKIEAEDKSHMETFSRLISTAPTVHPRIIGKTPTPTTVMASSSSSSADVMRGISKHRMVTTGRLTPEEEILNSEEELEREFAPPPSSSYEGIDVTLAMTREGNTPQDDGKKNKKKKSRGVVKVKLAG